MFTVVINDTTTTIDVVDAYTQDVIDTFAYDQYDDAQALANTLIWCDQYDQANNYVCEFD